MSNFLKEIIDHFNNNHLDEALNLSEKDTNINNETSENFSSEKIHGL